MAASYETYRVAPFIGELCAQKADLPGRCVREGLQLQIALRRVGDRRRLGDILVERGYLEREKLDSLLVQQRTMGLFDHPMIPGYRLDERIGRGGMAQVYLATQLSVTRPVAVKILHEKVARSDEDIKRFLREARSSAQLNHPKIVQAIDFGQVEETYYFVMEFIGGPTLQQLLTLYRSISQTMALGIARQVAEGLCHLEAHNMIHRDLKRTNVLIDGDQVKICDLGLAREVHESAADLSVTDQGVVLGTPHYISPEQAKAKQDIDIRADLYALGGILYRMVTGELPYRAESSASLLFKKSIEDVVPPEERAPHVSAEVSSLIQTLMARDPGGRFSTAKEALMFIDQCRAGLRTSGAGDTLVPIPAGGMSADGEDPAAAETRAPGELRPVLILVTGSGSGTRFPVAQDRVIVGRQSDCDLCVHEPWLSRHHFVVTREGEGWALEDLESRNGTKVNGQMIDQSPLHHGDEISVKDTRMVFMLEVAEG